MSIGILKTGTTPPELMREFGDLDAMMARMLGPGYATTTYDVTAGRFPDAVAAHPAYLVTGSAAGVYDPLPWIAPLEEFLRRASGSAKLVGICFGHQVMAQAFGGRVEKSPKGWGTGLHRYEVLRRAAFMDEVPAIAVSASHQDQVVEAPPDAEVLAGSPFAPLAVLAYPARRAISVQFHPEFEPAFSEALIRLDRADFGPELTAAALASLREPDDAARVAQWIRRFLAE